MLRRTRWLYLSIVVLIISIPAHGYSPVFGITSFVMSKGKWVYQFKDIFWDRDDGTEALALINSLAYGLTDHLTSDIVVYYLKRQIDTAHSSGIGDISLRLNYEFYTRKTEHYNLRLIAQNLVHFPTGNPRADPPLGLGTYRDRIGLGVDYSTSHYGIYNTTAYEFNLSTFKGFQAGNLFETTLSLEAKTSANNSFVAEIDFYTVGKDTLNGIKDPTSGGTILYAGPTIDYKNEYFKIAAAFQVPLFRDNVNFGIRCGFLINFYF